MLADHSLRKREKKVRETEDSRYIYQNELDKACFQYDIAYEDTRDLNRRTAADKVLHHKAFDIAKNQNMMDINMDLFQWSTNFLIKKLQVEQLK